MNLLNLRNTVSNPDIAYRKVYKSTGDISVNNAYENVSSLVRTIVFYDIYQAINYRIEKKKLKKLLKVTLKQLQR